MTNDNNDVNSNPVTSQDPTSQTPPSYSFVATMVSRKRKAPNQKLSRSSSSRAHDDLDEEDSDNASWRDVYRNIKHMDKLYDATFYSWLKSEDNVLVTSVYLHRIANEYSLPRIVNALKWLISDWRLESISILVRHVTMDWNGLEGDVRKSTLLRNLTLNWATQYTATLISTLLAHPPYTISPSNTNTTASSSSFPSFSMSLTTTTTTTTSTDPSQNVVSTASSPQPAVTPQSQKEHFLKAFTADWDFSKLSEFFMYLQAKANVGYKLKCHMLQEAARRERDVLGGKVLAGRKRNAPTSSTSPTASTEPNATTIASTAAPPTVRSHAAEATSVSPHRPMPAPSHTAVSRSPTLTHSASLPPSGPAPQSPPTPSPIVSSLTSTLSTSSSSSASTSLSSFSTTPIPTSSSSAASQRIRHHHRTSSNDLKWPRPASPTESSESDTTLTSGPPASSTSSSASPAPAPAVSTPTSAKSIAEPDTCASPTSTTGSPTSTATAPSFLNAATAQILCGSYRRIETVTTTESDGNSGGKELERGLDGRGPQVSQAQVQVSAGGGGGKRRMSVSGDT